MDKQKGLSPEATAKVRQALDQMRADMARTGPRFGKDGMRYVFGQAGRIFQIMQEIDADLLKQPAKKTRKTKKREQAPEVEE